MYYFNLLFLLYSPHLVANKQYTRTYNEDGCAGASVICFNLHNI